MEGKGIFRDSQDRKDFVTCLEDLSKQTATRVLGLVLGGAGAGQDHMDFGARGMGLRWRR